MSEAPVAPKALPGPAPRPGAVALYPIEGIGEIAPGTDLGAALCGALLAAPEGPRLQDGDVMVVTQKVVSKAEGRIVPIDPDDVAAKIAWSRASRSGWCAAAVSS